jgi:hypothetical protein
MNHSTRQGNRRRFAALLATLLAAGALVSAAGLVQNANATGTTPTPPFNECPAVGSSPTCKVLLTINADNSVSVYDDPAVGDYDGGDDTLVGVVNNSASSVPAITVKGPGSDLAGFDGDGLCAYITCTWNAPTGYEGPDNTFKTSPTSTDEVEVDFTAGGLAAGASSYFSLEGTLTSAELTARKGTLLGTPTVLFIQGIGSTSTCLASTDFVQRVSWLKSAIASQPVPAGDKPTAFAYYSYTSALNHPSTCSNKSTPQYTKLDTCWSIDNSYTAGGKTLAVAGEAGKLATFVHNYIVGHPDASITIVTHSQGGVLATYSVGNAMTASDAQHIQAIVTLDSPLRGINSIAPKALKGFAGCGAGDARFDSTYDMAPGSDVIQTIDTHALMYTGLYTVDANPGKLCSNCGFALVDDTHSTTSWATSHIRVNATTHSDIWNGCFAEKTGQRCAGPNGLNIGPQGRKLDRFVICATFAISDDCETYSEQ